MPLKTFRDVPFDLYLNISLIYFFKENTWSAETVIKIPSKKVEGWALPEMPGGWEKIYLLHFSTLCVLLLCSSACCRFTDLALTYFTFKCLRSIFVHCSMFLKLVKSLPNITSRDKDHFRKRIFFCRISGTVCSRSRAKFN